MLETAWEDRWMPDLYGGVAQLGEHLPCKQGVMSSNLTISIPCLNDAAQKLRFFAHVQARYKIEYLNSFMKTSFQQEFKIRFCIVPWKLHIEYKLNLKYSMKLSDSGQTDLGVCTQRWLDIGWRRRNEQTCLRVLDLESFISKRYKTSEAYRKIR